MTSQASSAVQSAVPEEVPAPKSQGVQARAREASVPTALPVLLPGDPPSPGIPPQAREALGRLTGAFTIPKGTDVLRASGLHAAHVRHTEAAGHWDHMPLVAFFRHLHGWLHLLLVKAPFGLLDWIAESPARLIAAVIVTVACTHWL